MKDDYRKVKDEVTVEVKEEVKDEVSGGTDGDECVVCLSDKRSVAVWPCRHVCLCRNCAYSLPAQGNKCPICRAQAHLVISFP